MNQPPCHGVLLTYPLFQGQYGPFVQFLLLLLSGVRQMSDGEELIVVTEQKCFDLSQPYVEVKFTSLKTSDSFLRSFRLTYRLFSLLKLCLRRAGWCLLSLVVYLLQS